MQKGGILLLIKCTVNNNKPTERDTCWFTVHTRGCTEDMRCTHTALSAESTAASFCTLVDFILDINMNGNTIMSSCRSIVRNQDRRPTLVSFFFFRFFSRSSAIVFKSLSSLILQSLGNSQSRLLEYMPKEHNKLGNKLNGFLQ